MWSDELSEVWSTISAIVGKQKLEELCELKKKSLCIIRIKYKEWHYNLLSIKKDSNMFFIPVKY